MEQIGLIVIELRNEVDLALWTGTGVAVESQTSESATAALNVIIG